MGNLAADLDARIAEVPDRVAVYFENREVSFREFDELASSIATSLRRRGVTPQDTVAAYMHNSIELLATMYGCWKARIALCPVSILYKGQDLAHAMEASGAEIVLSAEPYIERLESLQRLRVLSTTPLTRASGRIEDVSVELLQKLHFDAEPTNDEDIALLLFTSGSTGRPKVAARSHDRFDRMAEDWVVNLKGRKGPFPATREGTPPNLIALPLFHGGTFPLLFAMRAGRSIALMRKFNTEEFANLQRRFSFDNLTMVPTMLHMLANTDVVIDLSSVRFVSCSGGVLTPRVKRKFEERYGVPVHQNYGSTESGLIAGFGAADLREARTKEGSIGRPFPGVAVTIVGDGGELKPDGEVGEIVARGTQHMESYADDPGETDLVLRDGAVYTGDLGYLDRDGFLYLAGRKRDMIKRGGLQVFPGELEDVLLTYPGVLQAAVIGTSDDRLGEVPVAFVVPLPGVELDPEAIKSWCRSELAHYKCPEQILFIEEMPTTGSEKVDYVTLRRALHLREP